MAIVQTALGPNSAIFTTTGTAETPATMLAAVSAYIVTKGWTLIDSAAPQGQIAGHVFRAPQSGSTTVFKTVGISFGANNYALIPYEGWNSATHVGTNQYNYINQASSGVSLFGSQTNSNLNVEGTSIIVFANPRWLAIRGRTFQNVYTVAIGSFEISKDFGEAASIPSGIFMNLSMIAGWPTNAGGFFGTPGIYSGTASTMSGSSSTYNTILTPLGRPTADHPLSTLLTGIPRNYAMTMTAVEMTGTNHNASIKSLRGRIMGPKLVAGAQVWNDMDTAQVEVDADFMQSPGGTPTAHHVIKWSSTSYLTFLLPA